MRFLTKKPAQTEANNAILFMFEDVDSRSEFFNYLNELSDGKLEEQVFKFKATKRNFCEIFKIAINENLRVFIVGLGKKEKLTRRKFSQAASSAARAVKANLQGDSIAVELIDNLEECNSVLANFNKAQCAQILVCALRIGLYEFSRYISTKKPSIETLELICDDITPQIELAAQIGVYTSYAMKFAKDLINEPAQIVTPEYVANLALNIAKEYNLEIKVYNKNEIADMKMNAFLAVSQGSVNEPKFVHLIYKPKNKTPRKKVALIGKGITFDAGGMNIKPASSMLTMKSDMSGAATVLGIIQAISKLEPDIELHVISALCENMTSGSAYKQGDILIASNSKSIEVDNTDAEGRLTLADALCYADKLGVDEVIDIATLTGAVIVSLGNDITGVMGNNQKQIDKFIEISKESCENTWQMPIFDELKDNLKSDIADFKNTGGRNAGTSTAAWFLSNFTKSNAWMHLDIAGTAYLDKSNKETLSGPTGVMIRTLINYLLN